MTGRARRRLLWSVLALLLGSAGALSIGSVVARHSAERARVDEFTDASVPPRGPARTDRRTSASTGRNHVTPEASAASVRLEDIRDVIGVVRAADSDAPLAGVHVAVIGPSPHGAGVVHRSQGASDADGAFRLLLPSGAAGYDTLVACAPGYRIVRQVVDWGAPRRARRELRLVAAEERVTLLHEGRPLAGGRALVSAVSWGRGSMQLVLGTLDVAADGTIPAGWFERREVYSVHLEGVFDASGGTPRTLFGWTAQPSIDLDRDARYDDLMREFGHLPPR